ncbi:MAG: hypothetical protein HRT98_02490 [Mycoplasmatales bacterium]|nr:hypothetical protein [Mycoplasmatales bacterium]
MNFDNFKKHLKNTIESFGGNKNSFFSASQVIELINKKDFLVMVKKGLEKDIIAFTVPNNKMIVVNHDIMGEQEIESNLSKYLLLHEYFHILESTYAPLRTKESKNKFFEQADKFASTIFNFYNLEIPEDVNFDEES